MSKNLNYFHIICASIHYIIRLYDKKKKKRKKKNPNICTHQLLIQCIRIQMTESWMQFQQDFLCGIFVQHHMRLLIGGRMWNISLSGCRTMSFCCTELRLSRCWLHRLYIIHENFYFKLNNISRVMRLLIVSFFFFFFFFHPVQYNK